MQSGERHRDSKHLSKLQDGWGIWQCQPLHSSVIGFLELLISLSDLATGLLDPILVLGGSVVLVISLLTRALPKVSAGVHQSFMPDRPDCRRAVLAMVSAWALAAMSSVVRSDRDLSVGGMRASRSAASELRWSEVSRELSGGLRVLGVRVVSSGLGGGEGLHLLLLAVHGEGRQRGGGVVVTQGLLHVLSGPGTGEQHVGGAILDGCEAGSAIVVGEVRVATTSTR